MRPAGNGISAVGSWLEAQTKINGPTVNPLVHLPIQIPQRARPDISHWRETATDGSWKARAVVVNFGQRLQARRLGRLPR